MRHFEPLRPNRSMTDDFEPYEFAHGVDSLCVYKKDTMDFVKELPVGADSSSSSRSSSFSSWSSSAGHP